MRSPELARWRDKGRHQEVFGRRVFTVEEGPAATTAIVVLHGFPTCSLDFARALPVLARGHRVVLHDHLGFGLSEKPGDYSYSLLEQAEVAAGLWRALGITRAHLVAHDYGTSIATELLALRERGLLPIDLLSVTLSNGSILLELASLRPAQRILRNQTVGPLLARLSSERFFKRQIRRILARNEAVADAELEALFEALIHDGGREVISPISRYLDDRVRFRDRWFGALQRLDLPAHLVWGKKDPIAVAAIPEKLVASMPRVTLTWLEDLGHYPMLEAPERWAAEVLRPLEGLA